MCVSDCAYVCDCVIEKMRVRLSVRKSYYGYMIIRFIIVVPECRAVWEDSSIQEAVAPHQKRRK